MPARKPASLIVRHDTAADRAERNAQESAMDPGGALPMNAPARLQGHPVAGAAWRRLMRLYGELEAQVVTRLDADLLVDYCMLIEQIAELDKMRRSTYAMWERVSGNMDSANLEVALQAAALAEDLLESLVKIDARADRKRALATQMRQSLYLTPRARAGVAPKQKEKEEAPDELEMLLGEVASYVNNGGQGEQ